MILVICHSNNRRRISFSSPYFQALCVLYRCILFYECNHLSSDLPHSQSIKTFLPLLSYQSLPFYPLSLYSCLLLQPFMCLCLFFFSPSFWLRSYSIPVSSQSSLLLLLFFSMRRWRFSSRLLASSTSWCWRHLWKFSTTTPTNMFRTKKLTMRRNEMKYSSIHGLLLVTGWGWSGVFVHDVVWNKMMWCERRR